MKKFKLYFWNGFGEPELVATSLTGILRDVRLSDNYIGDVTSEIRGLARDYKRNELSWGELALELESYNLYMNPTYETFKEISRQWFDEAPSHLLKEFA